MRGDVNKLSAALSRSALEPVNDPLSSPKRSNSSSFELEARAFCFLIYLFLRDILSIYFLSKRTTYLTRAFKSDTGVITLARFPTGRAVIMDVKREAKMPTLSRSRFVFIRLVSGHFKRNKRRRCKKPEPRKAQNRRKMRKILTLSKQKFYRIIYEI